MFEHGHLEVVFLKSEQMTSVLRAGSSWTEQSWMPLWLPLMSKGFLSLSPVYFLWHQGQNKEKVFWSVVTCYQEQSLNCSLDAWIIEAEFLNSVFHVSVLYKAVRYRPYFSSGYWEYSTVWKIKTVLLLKIQKPQTTWMVKKTSKSDHHIKRS